MACFVDSNVSQGRVATYARCGEIFNIHLPTNLQRNLPLKKLFLNRYRFDRIVAMSLWTHFFGPPCRLHLLDACDAVKNRFETLYEMLLLGRQDSHQVCKKT